MRQTVVNSLRVILSGKQPLSVVKVELQDAIQLEWNRGYNRLYRKIEAVFLHEQAKVCAERKPVRNLFLNSFLSAQTAQRDFVSEAHEVPVRVENEADATGGMLWD